MTKRRSKLNEQDMRVRSRAARAISPIIIVLAGIASYSTSFSGVFLFDDERHILRVVQDAGGPDAPGLVERIVASRRPIVSLSLAVNHAIGGMSVTGYHVFNLTIHLLAGLTLYGLLRRTMVHVRGVNPADAHPRWVAMSVALIWIVHPLQTQSVTYIIQRGESLMGLFYLLTLYCMVRGAAHKSAFWSIAAVVCCALGMGSKGVMVTAPFVVILFDRLFLASSWKEVLRQRRWMYVGLALTWCVLAMSGVVGGVLKPASIAVASVGFGYKDISPLEYALSEPGVIVHYIRLALWPSRLCLDYVWPVARTAAAIVPPSIVIASLLCSTVWALVRVPWLGFCGAWFFLILGPTSSFIPIIDLAFEHRMYLPLAGIVVAIVVGADVFIRYIADRQGQVRVGGVAKLVGSRGPKPAARGKTTSRRESGGAHHRSLDRWVRVILVSGTVTALSVGTYRRNGDYDSGLTMWLDVVAKRPGNYRGHTNLASALKEQGEYGQAIEHCRTALRLNPSYADARCNLGIMLFEQGRTAEAITELRRTVRLDPKHRMAHLVLGTALSAAGYLDEAVTQFRRGLRINPRNASGHQNLGNVFAKQRKLQEAVASYRRAMELDPRQWQAPVSLGNTLSALGQVDEALAAYRQALQINPAMADVHYQIASILTGKGDLDGARTELRQALKIQPNHANAASALAQLGND